MPKSSLIYVFYPKGISPDIRRSLFDALKSAEADLKRELKGKSYTNSEMLSKLKTLIKAKTTGIPFTIRIATVEAAEFTRDKRAWFAEKALGWDRRVEDFSFMEYPHFTKVVDPVNQPANSASNIIAIGYIIGYLMGIGYLIYKRLKG